VYHKVPKRNQLLSGWRLFWIYWDNCNLGRIPKPSHAH